MGRLVMRLLVEILCLVLQTSLRIAAELSRCLLRLLDYSVRRYGWGRVGGFALSLYAAISLRARWAGLQWNQAAVWSIIAGTLVIYGVCVCLLPSLIREQWRRQVWRGHVAAGAASPAAAPPAFPAFPAPAEGGLVAAPGGPGIVSLRAALAPAGTEAMPPAAPAGSGALWERLTDGHTLAEAARRVASRGGGPGGDGVTADAFLADQQRQVAALAGELRAGTYRPLPPRWVDVPKASGGTRKLAILCVRDRVAQQAACQVLVTEWDPRFSPCSYAFRPGRSPLQAVSAVESGIARGRLWVVDADIRSFLDSVPHARLSQRVAEWLEDARMRWFLDVAVAGSAPAPHRGLPQGAPTSPLLANLYLHPFDTAMEQHGYSLVRYADDFVLLCATRQQADDALHAARRLLQALELVLHPDKTRVVHRDEGFTFLGYEFGVFGKRPTDNALRSLQRRLDLAPDEAARERVLVGWEGYFGPGAANAPEGDAMENDQNPEIRQVAGGPPAARVPGADWDAYRRLMPRPPVLRDGPSEARFKARCLRWSVGSLVVPATVEQRPFR